MTANDPLAPMRCLCIGGSYDGEYVEALPMGRLGQLRLDKKPSCLHLSPHQTKVAYDSLGNPYMAYYASERQFEFYHIEQICYPEDIVFSLWVLDGIKPHEAMERLIRRYANAAVKPLPVTIAETKLF